jgi:hypothetical protein
MIKILIAALLAVLCSSLIVMVCVRCSGVPRSVEVTTYPNSSQQTYLCDKKDLHIISIEKGVSCCNQNGSVIWFREYAWPWTDSSVMQHIKQSLGSIGLEIYERN